MLPALLLGLTLSPVLLHPDSLSSSLVRVSGHDVHHTLRCQVLSLLEVIEGLDADGDEEVSPAELEAKRAEVFTYVMEHYTLRAGTDRELQGGELLVPQPVSLSWLPPETEVGTGYRKGVVDIEFLYRAERPIRDLMVECTLFLTTSPDHIELTTFAWEDGTSRTFALEARETRGRMDREGRGAFGAFVGLGWRHILGGWDHLAFLLALVLASRRLLSLLGVVTAFTLAHSLTLALAALQIVDVSAHAALIEAAIALSIAYVAVDNLVHPHLRRSRWIEAFVFGLVHGLGFAAFLRQSLVDEASKATALFAFNVGVELGQILVVVAVVSALGLLPRRGEEDDPFLAPLVLRRFGSAVVAACGLFWFLQRI